jgi:hypothetical protein
VHVLILRHRISGRKRLGSEKAIEWQVPEMVRANGTVGGAPEM